jgi:hypothetical protein
MRLSGTAISTSRSPSRASFMTTAESFTTCPTSAATAVITPADRPSGWCSPSGGRPRGLGAGLLDPRRRRLERRLLGIQHTAADEVLAHQIPVTLDLGLGKGILVLRRRQWAREASALSPASVGSSRARICPGLTTAPTSTRRSTTLPPMRKARSDS